jgi:hypothetical protein
MTPAEAAYTAFQQHLGTDKITHGIPGAKEPTPYSVAFDRLPPHIQALWHAVADAARACEVEYASPVDRARRAPGYDKPERYSRKHK